MQNSLAMAARRVRLAAVSNFRSSSRCLVTIATRAMSTEAASKTSDTPNMENYNFETLKVTQPKDFVLHVELNRPEKRNAMNTAFWREMVQCFQTISTDKDCRAVVVSGAGKMFTSGIDLIDAAGILAGDAEDDISRKATKLHGIIQSFQQSFTSIEKCPKPVIAAVHSACIGGGIDLISACDIRYCTQDAWFQIKEVDIGLAADVGTLQRLPKIVGNDSLVRELTYTARRMMSDEAQQCGLVSRTFPDKESMVTGALETAALIALKSPVAVQGSKINLVYSRDHSVDESLRYIAAWNQCMLQSEDLVKAVTAVMEKTPPVFSKL